MVVLDSPDVAKIKSSPLKRFLDQAAVRHSVLGLIILNAVVLGLETSDAAVASYGTGLRLLDQTLLCVFVLEIGLRIVAWRGAFFRDPWSLFDFAVVAISLVPASGPFAVLRALRVLRVLRVLTIVPSMRRVVGGLLAAMPGLFSIGMVLLLVFYVFGVVATQIFGDHFPDWFGSLGSSLFTLFQIMTLESWSMGIVRPLMEVFPYAWMFFIPFILVATFTMLNLFIGVIVSAMQTFVSTETETTVAAVDDARHHIEADSHAEMRAIRADLADIKRMLRNSEAR